MNCSNCLLAAATATIVFASAAPGRADPYHSAEHRFRLDVPAGWEACSAEELKRTNQISGHEFPGMDVAMVAGFRPVGSAPAGRPGPTPVRQDAIVFVQFDRRAAGKAPFEELEAEITRDLAAVERDEPEAMLRLGRRMIFTAPEFDRARKRFVVRGTSDRRRSTVRSVGYPGPDGLVILHGYTRPGGSEADLAAITQLGDSFRFDEPDVPPTFVDRVFGDRVGPVGRMAIVGVAIAVLVWVVGAVVLRDKPARRPG